MKLPASAAFLILGAFALTCCKEDSAYKNDVSDPLTAQELARILQVHAWKIKISEIPADAEWLEMVVIDQDGNILQRGNSMGLAELRDAKKPLNLLIGLQMNDGDASITFHGNGGGSRFTLADPLDAKARRAAGKNFGNCTSDGSAWDRNFLHLMSDSPIVGFGAKPFPQATRIIALYYRTEKDPSRP